MKVILTRDHEKLGSTGDIINVKDGFAKNFLIPNNIAILATKGNIKQMELVKKSIIKKEARNIEEAEKLAKSIDGIELKFMVNASSDGKLYGSITNKDIADKILEEKKIDIDRKKIDLEDHIKEVGNFKIDVKLYKEVKAKIDVEVVSEDVADEKNKETGPQEEKNTGGASKEKDAADDTEGNLKKENKKQEK